MIETWKPVVGFEGLYEISDMGNLRSVDRYVHRSYKMMGKEYTDDKFHKGQIIRASANKDGYLQVVMRDANRKCHLMRINRMVAMAFIPNPENKRYVNHKNHNKLDNTVDNLEWCTHKENFLCDLKVGMRKNLVKNNDNPKNKLSWEEVDWIRNHYKAGDSEFGVRPLSVKFKVSYSLIEKIVSNKARLRNPETDFYPEGYMNVID